MIDDQSIILLSLRWRWEFFSIVFFSRSYGNQIFARQIVINHTFVFYLVLLTQCLRPVFLSETFLFIFYTS
jgi:hypothetical protein